MSVATARTARTRSDSRASTASAWSGFSYGDREADIILRSHDGVNYHVYAFDLKRASNWFADLFRVPRTDSAKEPLIMEADSDAIAVLLDVITPGKHPQAPIPLKVAAAVFSLAIKYDMPSVTLAMRDLIFKDAAAYQSPLEVYWLARTFGTQEHARRACKDTLDLDLAAPEYTNIQKAMDSTDLYDLFALRRIRKKALLEHLEGAWQTATEDGDDGQRFDYLLFQGTGSRPPADGKSPREWFILLYLIAREMDILPSGDSIRAEEFWDRPELNALWERTDPWGDRYVDKQKTMKAIIRLLGTLPEYI